jgi:hypothetical protein
MDVMTGCDGYQMVKRLEDFIWAGCLVDTKETEEALKPSPGSPQSRMRIEVYNMPIAELLQVIAGWICKAF